ncbi:MAG: rhodanese-like domain-containing protein [Candidatus Marinarcus sp.]|uniref:rhodanese-like domain-containing protein n=1 Tax=Candidatus Marinarcus sp. TaxID=3100987 RepID=UPI003B000AA3
MNSMVLKTVLIVTLGWTISFASNYDLNGMGVAIKYVDDNDKVHNYVIKRDREELGCTKVNGADPEVIWSGDYANANVPAKCKKTFVTTVGKIAPITIAKGIETVGEIEVIDFMIKAQTDKNMLLIDARMPSWFVKKTIPTAQNIPFSSFDPEKKPFEFSDTLELLGVESNDGVYDFSKAKTLLLFCNGAWCPQSTWAIQNLLKIGYPVEKLSWYRGGMYSWTLLNLTTIKP